MGPLPWRAGRILFNASDYALRDQRVTAHGNYYAVSPMFRDQLIERQDKTAGSWNGEAGDAYATSMALIILQMPNRYLPVYSGKGPGN